MKHAVQLPLENIAPGRPPVRRVEQAFLPVNLLLALLLVASAAAGNPALPRYAADGQLLRPEGFREWIFAGASYSMSYNEASEKPKEPDFHNIYIPPAAYRHFQKHGEFPDKTVIVMEVFTAGSRESINRQGRFADESLGIEAAVKDTERFPEKWAYFDFRGRGGPPRESARPFPKERCWSCHHEHAATDNVFTQFYPVLRRGK